MIRNYCGEDIARIIDLWNVALPEHKIDERLFIKNVLLDMNFDAEGFLVYEEKGEILGFAWVIVRGYPIDTGAQAEEDRGYLNLFVLKNKEDILGGAGDLLLARAEKYVKDRAKSKILVSGYTPNYFYPGQNVRCGEYLELYAKHGYTEQKRNYSIRADLEKFVESEELEELIEKRSEEGFVLTHLRAELIPSLLSSLAPGWRHRHRRLLNECNDPERFCLVVYGGEVIGSAIWGDTYSGIERFGPYGVNERYRGLGLGKILLYYTLKTMKKRGLKFAFSQSTPSSGAAAEIYKRLGFERVDEFVVLAKELK